MQVDINYQGKLQFEAIARHHLIWSDQPHEHGGENKGMTPAEWFLAALGSCAGFYVVGYCQARDIDATGLTISVFAQKNTAVPAWLHEIQIHINLPIAFVNDHYLEGLKQAVETCLIHNTLTHSPKITTQIHAGGYLQAIAGEDRASDQLSRTGNPHSAH